MDTLIQATSAADCNMDTLIQAADAEDCNIDALIQATSAEDCNMDTLIQAADAEDCNIDALIQATSAEDCNMDMDALIQAAEAEDCNIVALLQSAEAEDCNIDALLQAGEALIPMLPESAKISGDYMLTNEDQRFLLVFIMGTYFGPDVKAENPKKSALQRITEGLPAYTSDQLTGSEMKMANAEQVYYYVLRNADIAVVLNPSLLHQFFQGNLKNQEMNDPAGDHRQFPDLFPTHMHPQSYHGGQYKIIKNVVFINNPETYYMKQEDIERFKRLSGLEDLMLDRNEETWGGGISSNTDNKKLEDLKGEPLLTKSASFPTEMREEYNVGISSNTDNKKLEDLKGEPLLTKSASFPTEMREEYNVYQELDETAGPAMLLLSSCPTKQLWDNIVASTKNGIQYYGSMAKRPVGPLIGLVDIGECEDAYLFHVSLPGVSRNEDNFACKVETDGRVVINGVTVTGHKYVNRFNQIFEMQTQILSPPGPFTVSFKLPGPIDPNEFTGNFGDDGILEGIVLKQKS